MEAAPRFAVDRMLGRLARWLRLLRFDALYRPDLPGRRLLTLAAREGRVLLTRDRALLRVRSPVRVVAIAADHFREQLRELDRSLPLGGIEARAPRCAECNVPLEAVELDRLPDSVPAYVRVTETEFLRCPGCRRVYWPATHIERMSAEIASLGLTPPAAAESGDGSRAPSGTTPGEP